MRDSFLQLAARVTNAAGSPYALVIAAAVIVTWLVTGPLFGFSDTWQLVINTATTIVTFLMVFVIQATTNREMKATQIKLDELIRAVHGARNAIIATDLIPEADVEKLEKEFEAVGKRAQVQAARHTAGASRADGKGPEATTGANGMGRATTKAPAGTSRQTGTKGR